MIIFFPSYKFLRAVKTAWQKNGKLNKIRERKEVGKRSSTSQNSYVRDPKVFFEPEDSKDVEKVLTEYTSAVHKTAVSDAKYALFITQLLGRSRNILHQESRALYYLQ